MRVEDPVFSGGAEERSLARLWREGNAACAFEIPSRRGDDALMVDQAPCPWMTVPY